MRKKLFNAIKITVPESLYTKEAERLQGLGFNLPIDPSSQNRIIRVERVIQFAASFKQTVAPKGLISEIQKLLTDEVISSYTIGKMWDNATFSQS